MGTYTCQLNFFVASDVFVGDLIYRTLAEHMMILKFYFLFPVWLTAQWISFSGGSSSGCPENAGGAGTLYDAVPRSLIVDNYNMSTDTETLLLDFPNSPLWTNVYIRNKARASVPLLWSRVQVCAI